MKTLQKIFIVNILLFGLLFITCKTTPPFEYTDTFNVSSEHFVETRSGPWETVNNTQFRIIIEHEEKIICVRGRVTMTINKKDNYKFRATKPAEDYFPGAEGRIKVHSGFLLRYEGVRHILLDIAHQYPDYAIRISGVSLGATWTQLFLLDVILHWPDRDVLAILYAPANPWRRLPKKYQKELEQRTVFVCSHWDPITWMRPLFYFRYGHDITIGRWWRFWPPQHHPTQMLRSLEEMK